MVGLHVRNFTQSVLPCSFMAYASGYQGFKSKTRVGLGTLRHGTRNIILTR
jgi:hypothetical protein